MPIQIKINLAGLRGRLSRSLQRTILLVAAGLQNLDALNADSLELPTGFQMTFDAGLKWTAEEASENYSEWILINGFREAIETIGLILEDAHRVLSIWRICQLDGKQARVSGSDWNDVVVNGARQFHRLGLPHKLEHLKISHDLDLDEKIVSHALSINKARNCLVHRDGIVSERDITTCRELRVTWRRMGLFVENEKGERPIQIPADLEKGDQLIFRNVDTERSFAINQRIVFSSEEFAEICWCLFLLGEELMQKMNLRGVEGGFLTPTKLEQRPGPQAPGAPEPRA